MKLSFKTSRIRSESEDVDSVCRTREQKRETSSQIISPLLIWDFDFTKHSWTQRRLRTCLWWYQLRIEMFVFSTEAWRPFARRAGWRPRLCRDTLSIRVPINTPLSLLRRLCKFHMNMRCYFIIKSYFWFDSVLMGEMKPVCLCRTSHRGHTAVEKLYCSKSTTVEK